MDLQTLSRRNRGEANSHVQADGPASRVPQPRRRWVTRVLVPAAILLATLMLIAYAARDLLLPGTQVAVVRAIALSSQRAANTGESNGPSTVIAQAPGWVEPDPYPIYVTALADGVVDRIHVLEGETVEAGQVLVELVSDDAELGLAQARAELARREAALTAAESDFTEPVTLRRAEAVSRARLAEAQAARARLDAEIAKEQAKLAELSASYDRLASMTQQSVSALQVEAVKYQVQSQRAVVEATRQRYPELEAAVDAAEAELAAARRDLELKTALRRIRDEAAAAVQSARAHVDKAQLRLERMTIKSPTDGVVMERLVAPGAKLMLGMDQVHSAHAIHLYDPSSLQVRVDVPLVDAASVGVGQDAIVVVDVLPDIEFSGVVTRLVHQADIAKNTVQFKVAISEPSPLLKPDMLARVKFFGGTDAGPSEDSAGSPSGAPVAIQRSSVVEGGSGKPYVWWVSPIDRRLERRPITLGPGHGDGIVEVRSGLNPGDVVVDRPDASLEEGQRARIRDENGM